MSQSFRASQEVLVKEELFDEYQPSTQEIVAAQTQEASNASDFFDVLRASQISTSSSTTPNNSQTNSPANSQSSDYRVQSQFGNGISSAIFNAMTLNFDANGQEVLEKKKRGRKRKIRTNEELLEHMRDKKEKNRLAAQRLRKKKCQEIAKYDEELNQLETNVKEKRRFADLIQTKVNKLRNKIEVMAQQSNDSSNDKPEAIVKSEPNQSRGKCLDLLGLANTSQEFVFQSALIRR